MCCFSGKVEAVSGTRIFCRFKGARQLLAYSMTVAADREVAMVLPIPVPAGSGENAVSFIDLSRAPDFFGLLESMFEVTGSAPTASLGHELDEDTLVVQKVGNFVWVE